MNIIQKNNENNFSDENSINSLFYVINHLLKENSVSKKHNNYNTSRTKLEMQQTKSP